MPEAARALLALWNDVDPAVEAAYNDWHAIEHVPERCSVPGILWGRRYGLAAGLGMPRYLTLYGLRDPQVLDSEPYRRLLREPTPASRAMRPALRNVSRWVCSLVCDRATEGGADLALRLGVGEAPPGASGASDLLARRTVEAAPLPWLVAAQGQALVGDWLWGSPRLPDDAATPVYRRLR